MTIHSDFAHLQIAAQNHRDLIAQRAHDRLVREATAGRRRWWQRENRRHPPATRLMPTLHRPTTAAPSGCR